MSPRLASAGIGVATLVVMASWRFVPARLQLIPAPLAAVILATGAAALLRIRLVGNATFLRLPRILDTLESLPHDRTVELDLSELRHLDRACRTALLTWTAQRNSRGPQVHVSGDLGTSLAA